MYYFYRNLMLETTCSLHLIEYQVVNFHHEFVTLSVEVGFYIKLVSHYSKKKSRLFYGSKLTSLFLFNTLSQKS